MGGINKESNKFKKSNLYLAYDIISINITDKYIYSGNEIKEIK
jgi:hypothetical protein